LPWRFLCGKETRIATLDRPGKHTMSVLDRLYRLEIEFHRLFRAEGVNALEAASVHTSYALQNNYEPLLRTVGIVDPSELAKAAERMMGMGDPRDVQAAFHSLRRFIRVA
jgi:hypothetical protein